MYYPTLIPNHPLKSIQIVSLSHLSCVSKLISCCIITGQNMGMLTWTWKCTFLLQNSAKIGKKNKISLSGSYRNFLSLNHFLMHMEPCIFPIKISLSIHMYPWHNLISAERIFVKPDMAEFLQSVKPLEFSSTSLNEHMTLRPTCMPCAHLG